ncbi:hypothetical protein E4U44_000483 [Claviceps purpurea]|nr:hypothetical protein E4U44_000483 [Claviceps purpurea]
MRPLVDPPSLFGRCDLGLGGPCARGVRIQGCGKVNCYGYDRHQLCFNYHHGVMPNIANIGGIGSPSVLSVLQPSSRKHPLSSYGLRMTT